MTRTFFFLGCEDTRSEINKSLAMTGDNLEPFRGWHEGGIIIYELNNVDEYDFFIPDNLIIITRNNRLMNKHQNIFFHDSGNFRFSFSRFIKHYLNQQKEKDDDIFEFKEPLSILYFKNSEDLNSLVDLFKKSKKYNVRKLPYTRKNLNQPIKTIVFLNGIKNAEHLSNSQLLVIKVSNPEEKKELRNINPLVPKIFIKNINKSTLKKIIKALG